MIRDITLGQYYPAESVIHRIDPRLKIIMTLAYIITLFFVRDFVAYAFIIICLGTVIKISKVPLMYILRGMKPVFIILIFTFTLNMFMTDGTVIVKFGFLKITEEGLYNAVFMAFRLVLLIIGSFLLTFTTKPVKLTDGIESILNPLRKIGVPAHELAMMMTIALRFIPTLLEETDKIMKAQQARGADFETGNMLKRAKNLIPILIPLFIGAFRIAQDLALAMEARCYRGGEGRTKLHELELRKRDWIGVVIMLIFVMAVLAERFFIGPLFINFM